MKVLQVTSPIHPGHSLLVTYIFTGRLKGEYAATFLK